MSVVGWRWSAAARLCSVVLVAVAVALVVRAVLRPPIDLQVHVLGGLMELGRGDDLCAVYPVSVATATVVTVVAMVVETTTTSCSLGQLNIILCWAVVEDVLGIHDRDPTARSGQLISSTS